MWIAVPEPSLLSHRHRSHIICYFSEKFSQIQLEFLILDTAGLYYTKTNGKIKMPHFSAIINTDSKVTQ